MPLGLHPSGIVMNCFLGGGIDLKQLILAAYFTWVPTYEVEVTVEVEAESDAAHLSSRRPSCLRASTRTRLGLICKTCAGIIVKTSFESDLILTNRSNERIS
jgi:hypothetical protein